MMFRKRTANLMVVLVGFALLLAGCQVRGDSSVAPPSLAPTATPEPERPTPQSGPDADGDWLSDADEEKFGTDPTRWDTDEDGSTDFEEVFIIGSDPAVFEGDTDEDWLRDVTEELVGSDPNTPDEDRDEDGIPDLRELKLGADPGKIDTDGDLLSDFLELFLTETDPAVANPIDTNGFPEPLVPWLPEQLQDVTCEVAVVFTMDQVYVPNPEEADSPNDIIVGDDTYVKYGLWTGQPADDELAIEENTPYTAVWFGKAVKDTVWDRSQFRVLSPVITECGETVTLAVQAIEDDSPFGGVWHMGTWRHDLPLVFHRLPFGWWHSRQDSFYFYGETPDSDYEYDFTYSFAVQLLSSITSSEEVIAEYERQFASAASGQTALTNNQATQAMILSWMLLGLFDSSTGGEYQTDNSFDNYIPTKYYYNPTTGATTDVPCSGCQERMELVPGG